MSVYTERRLGDILEPCIRAELVCAEDTYRIAGVYSFGRGIFERSPISGADTKYSKLNRICAGDFVLSRLKAFEGAVAIASQRFDGCYVSQEFPTFVIRESQCLPEYLAFVCGWPSFWERLSAGSKGVGSRRERVGTEQLLSTMVPLPDTEEQRRIVAKLDAALIALPTVTDQRDRLEAALMPSMVRSVFDGGFPMRPAGQVLQLERRPIDIDPIREYRYVGIRSFGNGIIHYPPTKGSELSKLRFFAFPANALALSNIKAWEGAIGVTSQDEEGFIASSRFLFYVQRRSDEVDPRFVAYYLLSSAGLADLGRASPGSADRNRTLAMASFERIQVPVPPIGLQRSVADRLDHVQLDLGRVIKRRQRLQGALRTALLNAAFSGQL